MQRLGSVWDPIKEFGLSVLEGGDAVKHNQLPSSAFVALDSREQPISIRIHSAALRRLRNEAVAAKARNVETAGLLLGSAQPDSLRPVVVISSCVSLPPEDGAGNSCLYSDASRAVLEEYLHAHDGARQAVGFYHASVHGDSALSEYDMRVMTNHFASPGSVFVSLAGSRQHVSASFFAWDGEEESPRVRACYRLQLDPRDFEREEPDTGGHAVARRRPELRRKVPIVLASLLGVAVVALGALEYRISALLDRQRQAWSQPAAPTALDLRTERVGSQWRLTWNRDANAIRTAAGGHLSIVDGFIPKEVELSATELQSGSIVYSPLADDVRFRLEVYDNGRSRRTSESVRVLGRPWPNSPIMSGYLDDVPAGAYRFTDTRRSRRERPKENAVEPRTDGPAEEAPSQPALSADAREPARPGPTVQSDMPQPPALDGQSGSIDRTLEAVPAALSSSMPPSLKEPPPSQGAAMPAEPARTPEPVPPRQPADANAQDRAVGSQVQEPVLIRRLEPVYPRPASQMRVAGVVRIQATIGKDGKVHNPRSVSGPEMLRGAAVAAVRQWLYRPRMLNGEPVDAASEIDVRFTLKTAER